MVAYLPNTLQRVSSMRVKIFNTRSYPYRVYKIFFNAIHSAEAPGEKGFPLGRIWVDNVSMPLWGGLKFLSSHIVNII